jgi:hypothetical protein
MEDSGKLFSLVHHCSPLSAFLEKFCGVVAPIQGLFEPDPDPGRRCALPWAVILWPFRPQVLQAGGAIGELRLFWQVAEPGFADGAKNLRHFAAFCAFSRLFPRFLEIFFRERGAAGEPVPAKLP